MPTFYNQAALRYNDTTALSNIVQGELLEVLSVNKTAVSDSYTAGDVITYTISIVNTGNTDYTGLTLTDDLGAYPFGADTLYPTTYVDGTVNYYVNGVLQTDPAVVAGPPLTVSGINVPANGNALVIYSVRVNEFAPLSAGSNLVNSANITGGGLAEPLEATATLDAANAPVLSLSKSINSDTVAENDTVTYTIRIQNNGSAEATTADNVIVTDMLMPPLTGLTVAYNGTPWVQNTNYTYDAATGAFATLPNQIAVPAADYAQDPATGAFRITPGTSTITISGTI